jgi:hypothetical protein
MQPVFEGHNQRDASPWLKLSEFADLTAYLGKRSGARRATAAPEATTQNVPEWMLASAALRKTEADPTLAALSTTQNGGTRQKSKSAKDGAGIWMSERTDDSLKPKRRSFSKGLVSQMSRRQDSGGVEESNTHETTQQLSPKSPSAATPPEKTSRTKRFWTRRRSRHSETEETNPAAQAQQEQPVQQEGQPKQQVQQPVQQVQQVQQVQRVWQKGDHVKIVKTGTQIGKTGVVSEPDWGDRVKILMDDGQGCDGAIKSYLKQGELVQYQEPKQQVQQPVQQVQQPPPQRAPVQKAAAAAAGTKIARLPKTWRYCEEGRYATALIHDRTRLFVGSDLKPFAVFAQYCHAPRARSCRNASRILCTWAHY